MRERRPNRLEVQLDPRWHYVQEKIWIQEDALPSTVSPLAAIGCGGCRLAGGWLACRGAGLQRSCWCPSCLGRRWEGLRPVQVTGHTHCTEVASGHWLLRRPRTAAACPAVRGRSREAARPRARPPNLRPARHTSWARSMYFASHTSGGGMPGLPQSQSVHCGGCSGRLPVASALSDTSRCRRRS